MDNSERHSGFIKKLNEHRALLHKVCNIYCTESIDRQDLFQEIVIQLWKSYPQFKGDAKFSTWLYRIALNTAISGFRKRKLTVVQYEPAAMNGIEHIDFHHDTEDRFQLMYTAINQLSDVEKGIVTMYLEEKSYEEMEEVFGISQNTLRVKMNRIKEKLRKITHTISHGTGKN